MNRIIVVNDTPGSLGFLVSVCALLGLLLIFGLLALTGLDRRLTALEKIHALELTRSEPHEETNQLQEYINAILPDHDEVTTIIVLNIPEGCYTTGPIILLDTTVIEGVVVTSGSGQTRVRLPDTGGGGDSAEWQWESDYMEKEE